MKKVSRDFEKITRPLEKNLPAIPPGQMLDFEEETNQARAWKRFILWEKQNPLKLSNEQDIIKRVMFAYEQSFLSLGYHCDIWQEAANYLINIDKTYPKLNQSDKEFLEMTKNNTEYLYERALNSFMKNNTLLNLIYADYQESRSNFQKVYELYENSIQNVVEPTLAWVHYIRFVRRHEDIAAVRRLFKRAREDPKTTYHLYIANANLEYLCTKVIILNC